MNNHLHITSYAFRWRGAFQEIFLVVALYGLYTLTQGLLTSPAGIAVQHANDIINIERYLHIYQELNIQSWVLNNSLLVRLADAIYTYCFYPEIVIFAIWAYTRHRQQYITARNVFLVSAAIGLICFALYPTAPPRLTPGTGFVDTLAEYEAVYYSSEIPPALMNQYAAIPSFHFGWALLVGVSTVLITRHRWLKILGALLPVLMFFSIIATGNHYFLDAVAGAIVIALALGIVMLLKSLNKKKYQNQPQKDMSD